MVYKSVTLDCCFTCCCCFWCLNIVHVGAADVFAVCGWVFRAAPNDPTHTSSGETAVTERVPAEPSPFPLNCKPGLLCAHRRLVQELWHILPTCKSLMAAINTFACLWLHSEVVLQHNKSINRSGRCLTLPRRGSYVRVWLLCVCMWSRCTCSSVNPVYYIFYLLAVLINQTGNTTSEH